MKAEPAASKKSPMRIIIAAVVVILVIAAVATLGLGVGGSKTPSSSATTSSGTSASSAASSAVSGGPFNTPGNLLITDQFNNRVVEVNPLTNKIVWSFGSGNGSLCNPGPGSIIGPNDAERLAGGLTLMAGTGNPSGFPPPWPLALTTG